MEGFLFVDVKKRKKGKGKGKNKKSTAKNRLSIPVNISHSGTSGRRTEESSQEKEPKESPPFSEKSPDTAPVSTEQINSGQDKSGDDEISIIDREQTAGLPSYKLPPLTLLARPNRIKNIRYNKDINENVRILEDTLESFGVKARVIQVSGYRHNPLRNPAPSGVKVSRIVGLADDIALSMAAPGVRIEAPIPGKAAVGIGSPTGKYPWFI